MVTVYFVSVELTTNKEYFPEEPKSRGRATSQVINDLCMHINKLFCCRGMLGMWHLFFCAVNMWPNKHGTECMKYFILSHSLLNVNITVCICAFTCCFLIIINNHKKLTLRGVDVMNIVESTLLQISVPLNGDPVSSREVEALNQSGNQEVHY